mmetsp:Transcript_13445/g.27842  ORF Transcript_13445/g.27842 Transcript_13445/m.27842 type:complete len:200 (-) Transcript_13445:31-630(-)
MFHRLTLPEHPLVQRICQYRPIPPQILPKEFSSCQQWWQSHLSQRHLHFSHIQCSRQDDCLGPLLPYQHFPWSLLMTKNPDRAGCQEFLFALVHSDLIDLPNTKKTYHCRCCPLYLETINTRRPHRLVGDSLDPKHHNSVDGDHDDWAMPCWLWNRSGSKIDLTHLRHRHWYQIVLLYSRWPFRYLQIRLLHLRFHHHR